MNYEGKIMKAAILILVLTASLIGSAWARLGETEDQLVARYGQELLKTKIKDSPGQVAIDALQFLKSGFSIQVSLFNGISSEEEIHRLQGETLTDEEVKILLAVNAQGHIWTEDTLKTDVPRKWHRDDGATAELYQETFDFRTKALADAKLIAHDAATVTSLQGF